MTTFDSAGATRLLQDIAARHSEQLHEGGGFVRDGSCDFDSYVAVGAKSQYGVSIAIRKPKSAESYFAVRRKAAGRLIVEDRLPFGHQDLAVEYFEMCIRLANLRPENTTLGMIEQPEARKS